MRIFRTAVCLVVIIAALILAVPEYGFSRDLDQAKYLTYTPGELRDKTFTSFVDSDPDTYHRIGDAPTSLPFNCSDDVMQVLPSSRSDEAYLFVGVGIASSFDLPDSDFKVTFNFDYLVDNFGPASDVEEQTPWGEDYPPLFGSGNKTVVLQKPGGASWLQGEGGFNRGDFGLHLFVDNDSSRPTSAWVGINSIKVEVFAPWLFVTIPGINDHGSKVVQRAAVMSRSDSGSSSYIRHVDIREDRYRNLDDPAVINLIKSKVKTATRSARKERKDVIVNIDMDLENYNAELILPQSRWQQSVKWAGKVANIVSEAFRDKNPSGYRILYAHSAGGDAVNSSIKQELGTQIYDDINIFNGRTPASTLRKRLKKSGYKWWQVKVFTNRGDLPAMPGVPFMPWVGSLSNKAVVQKSAGKSWVSIHGKTKNDDGHSWLRNLIGKPNAFEVNLGKQGGPWNDEAHTVEDMMNMSFERASLAGRLTW